MLHTQKQSKNKETIKIILEQCERTDAQKRPKKKKKGPLVISFHFKLDLAYFPREFGCYLEKKCGCVGRGRAVRGGAGVRRDACF